MFIEENFNYRNFYNLMTTEISTYALDFGHNESIYYCTR